MLANMPLAALGRMSEVRQPFFSFRDAVFLRDRERIGEARAILRTLLATDGLGSRDRLQVWSALRELGAVPDRTECASLAIVVGG